MRLPSDAVAFGSDELSDRQPDAAGSFPRVDPPQQASRRLACGSLHTSVRVRGGALVLGRGARRRMQRGPAPALPARAWAAARASDVTGIAGFSGQAEDRLRRGRRGWGEPKAARTAPLLPSPSAGRPWRPGGSDAPAAGPPPVPTLPLSSVNRGFRNLHSVPWDGSPSAAAPTAIPSLLHALLTPTLPG